MRTAQEFWANVDKTGTCWKWNRARAKSPFDYGILNFQGTTWRAHRLAWIFSNGPIPDGLQVCHQCDNPPCVRPSHLFLGTAKDNMADMAEKWRSQSINHGAAVHSAKLSEEDVTSIREKYASGRYKQSELGEEYGVNPATICRIVNGRKWRLSFTGEISPTKKISRRTWTRKAGEPNPIVFCSCECGESFEKFDKWGRPREYRPGHN